MAKEFFAHPETRPLFNTLEDISRRSGVSRGQAFEDVLMASVAALAAETMEPEYFDAIKAHTKGKKGERGVDLFPVFFGQTVDAIARTDHDVLGDLFQGSISYAENGLYLTPQPVSELMARMMIDDPEESDTEGIDKRPTMISDPCCGTGILLMEAGKINPRAELIGQDIDGRCARISALNLGLRGKYGWVICGNTLTREVQFVYRIGGFFHEGPNGLRRGVIRHVPPKECPVLPELRARVNRDLLDTLDDDPPSDSPAEQSLPPIIEIPDWALRIEQRLAAAQATEPPEQPVIKNDAPQEKESEDSNDDPPRHTQQRLF